MCPEDLNQVFQRISQPSTQRMAQLTSQRSRHETNHEDGGGSRRAGNRAHRWPSQSGSGAQSMSGYPRHGIAQTGKREATPPRTRPGVRATGYLSNSGFAKCPEPSCTVARSVSPRIIKSEGASVQPHQNRNFGFEVRRSSPDELFATPLPTSRACSFPNHTLDDPFDGPSPTAAVTHTLGPTDIDEPSARVRAASGKGIKRTEAAGRDVTPRKGAASGRSTASQKEMLRSKSSAPCANVMPHGHAATARSSTPRRDAETPRSMTPPKKVGALSTAAERRACTPPKAAKSWRYNVTNQHLSDLRLMADMVEHRVRDSLLVY